MSGRLEGKVALITGAARGQGRSHAVRLAQEGADVIAVDLCAQVESVPYPMATPDDLAQTVAEVEALDRRIVAREADVRDLGVLRAAVDAGVEKLGRLDVVCANAGIASYGAVVDLSEQQWRDMIDTNLTGVWHAVKAAVPHIRAGGNGGSIVITSSTAGLVAYPAVGHYVTAKHGLTGLMRTLARELAPDMIRVNTVNPTSVDTPMVQNEATYGLFLAGRTGVTREEAETAFQRMNLLPVPWVEPVDVSNAVLFLVSDEARYVTGIALPVDAGAVIR